MKKILLISLFFHSFTCFTFGQELTEKQMELYKYLLDYRKPSTGDYELAQFMSFPKEDYYIPQIKKRFLELLVREWNQEEIEAWIDKYSKSYEKSFAIETEDILKKDTIRTFQEIYDSIKVKNLERFIEGDTSDYYVPSSVIAMAGWIDMPETVPYLETLLKNPKQQDKEVIKLALARLRVEPYYAEAFEKYTSEAILSDRYNIEDDCIAKVRALQYLGTEESIYAIGEWLLREEMYYYFYDSDLQSYVGDIALKILYERVFIKNKYFREKYFEENLMPMDDLEKLREIYDWMQENRGKVEYNRNYWIILED